VTGTDGVSLVPMLVPTHSNQNTTGVTAGKTDRADLLGRMSVTGATGVLCQAMTERGEKRVKGLEPSTFSLEG
jgi:hypothetical protein